MTNAESLGSFWILLEHELIWMEYTGATSKILFEKRETFSSKEYGLYLTELKQKNFI
jgi:Sec7-like guanine-nucleotide exchange factor